MDSELVGRDAQIAEIRAFLSAAPGAIGAVAITGDAGIGKTVVWQHVLQAAGRSSRVLSCRPTPAERPLAFSALDDLFGDVAEEVLPALPGPRRRAVELALAARRVHREPARAARCWREGSWTRCGSFPPTRRSVAVDDAQWLDRPSAGVLEFCFRRLQREPVSVLLTFRDGDSGGGFPLGLDRALPPDRLGRVQLGPLSLGAIGEILRSGWGRRCPGTRSRGCTRRAAGIPSTPSNAHVRSSTPAHVPHQRAHPDPAEPG